MQTKSKDNFPFTNQTLAFNEDTVVVTNTAYQVGSPEIGDSDICY
jgi:hypothetical protein